MKRHIRLVLGGIFLFLALSQFLRDDYELLSVVFVGLIALALLYPELLLLLSNRREILNFLSTVGRKSLSRVVSHVKETELERYCSVTTEKGSCGERRVFGIIATTHDPTKPADFYAGREIGCCMKHHLHPDKQGRGELKEETERMLEQRNLSVERIYMIERSYG